MPLRWHPMPQELDFSFIRASGPGGQHVNKVSSAVQLQFDIRRSSLPTAVQERLLALPDQRISQERVLVIKAQGSRSQAQNRAEAVQRLLDLVSSVAEAPRIRKPTRPTRASQQRRLAGKSRHGSIKANRAPVRD